MDKQQMLAVAAFNKLNLDEAEQVQMLQYLDFALGEFDQLAAVDCTGITPLVHSVEITNVFREDVALKTVSREQILANAPAESEGCFSVPMVVE